MKKIFKTIRLFGWGLIKAMYFDLYTYLDNNNIMRQAVYIFSCYSFSTSAINSSPGNTSANPSTTSPSFPTAPSSTCTYATTTFSTPTSTTTSVGSTISATASPRTSTNYPSSSTCSAAAAAATTTTTTTPLGCGLGRRPLTIYNIFVTLYTQVALAGCRA